MILSDKNMLCFKEILRELINTKIVILHQNQTQV